LSGGLAGGRKTLELKLLGRVRPALEFERCAVRREDHFKELWTLKGKGKGELIAGGDLKGLRWSHVHTAGRLGCVASSKF
jgi:hypothetical protein